jgi:hypothetical protein
MDHYEHPHDISGPEFVGLSHDEAFALKRQLRIRDRNRRLALCYSGSGRRTDNIAIIVALFIVLAIAAVFGLCKD